ncbi:putative pectinesterase [Medicago truncatula]|uniref:Pectinesterase inhibitor n=1 Tax=Medicago truncatula TaxID=3880 RepID=A2Q2X5_MEDTR|nr:Pectinesterase inhibitor [Medicago truncatula]AES65002.1 plant invertase/pectin methylesterase inhibitor [Medicago truncatula]RHN73061.1 putative pectinesterase [Medicago truncatula]
MKFINNKNNINLKIFYIILICFALEKCTAHIFHDTTLHIEKQHTSGHHHMEHPPTHSSHHTAHPPTHSSEASFDSLLIPQAQAQAPSKPEPGPEQQAFGHSASFKNAFSDLLKGEISIDPMTMPQHPFESIKQSTLGIDQICMHTDYPDICLATIQPLISINLNFELIDVLGAAIKVCTLQVKLTISKVAAHAAKNPEVASAVADCKEQYNSALDNLQKAADAIASRDLGTITVMLSAVMADVSTCESAFEDLKASPTSTMSSNDGLVSITVSNCLSIANLIPY